MPRTPLHPFLFSPTSSSQSQLWDGRKFFGLLPHFHPCPLQSNMITGLRITRSWSALSATLHEVVCNKLGSYKYWRICLSNFKEPVDIQTTPVNLDSSTFTRASCTTLAFHMEKVIQSSFRQSKLFSIQLTIICGTTPWLPVIASIQYTSATLCSAAKPPGARSFPRSLFEIDSKCQ